MKKESKTEAEITLRHKAEELMGKKTSKTVQQLSEYEAMRLVHELEVHQIELELQNEELILAKEKAAELATEKYTELYDFAPSAYFTLSMAGDILELNLCASQMLGKERSLLKKRRFNFFISDDTKTIFNNFLCDVFNKKTRETCELTICASGDKPIYVNIIGVATENGEQCLITASDITERKQNELALRESEARFRNILQDIPFLAVQGYGPDGTTQYWNKASERFYGYTAEEAIGQNLLDLIIPPEMHNEVEHAIREMASNGQPIPAAEMSLMRKDGSRISVLSNHAIVQLPGRPHELFCIDIDITERKNAEEALKLSDVALSRKNELLSSLLHNLQIGVFMVEAPSGKPLLANEMALKLLGRGILPDASRHNLAEVYKAFRVGSRIPYPPEEMPIMLGIAGKSAHINDMIVVRPDGTEIYLEIFGSPVKDNNGHIWASLVSFFDITERKQAEDTILHNNEQLQKINAEKDKFFSIIAHDLRSPFNGFLGLTEIMAEGLPRLTLDEIQQIAIAMRSSATNLFRLLGNLLEWSRMQRGLIPYNPVFFKLLPKIADSIALATDLANKKEISIDFKVPDNMKVYVDGEMLDGIMRNLITNAVKFTPRGGRIHVSAKRVQGNMAEISVCDSGIGMDKNMIENLFHLDVNTNRKGTEGEASTGLGLMICKDFIEKNGGKLGVESEEGKGSTFRFVLPIKPEVKKPPLKS